MERMRIAAFLHPRLERPIVERHRIMQSRPLAFGRHQVHRLATHEPLRIPDRVLVGTLAQWALVDRAGGPLGRIFRVPGEPLGDREGVELTEGQPKRSGDSEVSGELVRSSIEFNSVGSGPRPVLILTAAE